MSAPSILLVEDNSQFREVVARWLKESYTVHTVATGQEAMAQLDDELDVILLDRRLPDIPGDEILEEVAAEDLSIQVAMLTAVEPDFEILEMPFDDYLTKPVIRNELESTIETLLDRSTFDQKVQERYALSAKLAALETQKSRMQLETSEEYTQARARLAQLDAELTEIIDRSAERETIEEIYREIDSNTERPGVT